MGPSSGRLLSLAGAGASLQATSAVFLIAGAGPVWILPGLFVPGLVLWSWAFSRETGLRLWIPIAVAFIFPAAGPLLMFAGFLIHSTSRRVGYLLEQAEFAEYDTGLAVPGDSNHKAIRDRIRKLQPAGDILSGTDTAMKQAVITTIGRIRSSEVVRLLLGAKNDPDDEIRLTAATVLTRLDEDYREEMVRLRDAPSKNRNRDQGLACLAYADSGLVEAGLRTIALRDGLGHFKEAIFAGEEMDADLLRRVGYEAVRLGDRGFFDRVRSILEARGEAAAVSMLDLASCYERRDFRGMAETLSRAPHESGRTWSEMLAVWKGKRQGEIL
jgi:hypothetical protein